MSFLKRMIMKGTTSDDGWGFFIMAFLFHVFCFTMPSVKYSGYPRIKTENWRMSSMAQHL
jgi:hypothetical protein